MWKKEVVSALGNDDYYLWEYSGKGPIRKMYSWIFTSRLNALEKIIKKSTSQQKKILDIGCGAMLTSCVLANYPEWSYIGIDKMSSSILKKYRNTMRNVGANILDVIRASAEKLPLRDEVFNSCVSLDVLEHVKRPEDVVVQIKRVTKKKGIIIFSIPLENILQRVLRIGFFLVRLSRDPIIGKRRFGINNIMKMPSYHYVGDIKTHDIMMKMIEGILHLEDCKYTPIGFRKSLNINSFCVFSKTLE